RIHPHRHRCGTKMGTSSIDLNQEKLQNVVAEQIAAEVRKQCETRRKTIGQIPPDLLVQYVASTFILVLNWWVESRSPLSAKDIDNLFRALILPTLGEKS